MLLILSVTAPLQVKRSVDFYIMFFIDSSGSFLPLHPENTLNEINETSYRSLAPGLHNVNSDVMGGSMLSHSFDQSSIPVHGGLQYTSASLTGGTEEAGSFHELIATKTTINDSEFSEHPISYSQDKTNSRYVHFEELPVVHKELQSNIDSGTAGHFPSEYTKEESSVLPRQEITGRDTALGSSDQTPRTESPSPGSRSATSSNFLPSTIGSSASSLPSFAYTWVSKMPTQLIFLSLTILMHGKTAYVC